MPALTGAKVDEWMRWDDGSNVSFTPWLARRSVGLGAVTWVAQDLGNAELTEKAKTGWRYVWDRVFDWNNPTRRGGGLQAGGREWMIPWPPANDWLDLGRPLLHGMDLTRTAAEYLAIAMFLFRGVLAGGGAGDVPGPGVRASRRI